MPSVPACPPGQCRCTSPAQQRGVAPFMPSTSATAAGSPTAPPASRAIRPLVALLTGEGQQCELHSTKHYGTGRSGYGQITGVSLYEHKYSVWSISRRLCRVLRSFIGGVAGRARAVYVGFPFNRWDRNWPSFPGSSPTGRCSMTTAAPSTALATIQPAFTDAERVALAGYLAGYRGLTREAYGLDLRQFTTWCR